MVNIIVKKTQLLSLAGWVPSSEEEFERTLESIKCVVGGFEKASDELTLEVTPDRPDLLTVHGIVRNLKGALGKESGVPESKFHPPVIDYFVEQEAYSIRPAVVGAVVEGVRFSPNEIADLFALQEKLDFTIGRRRRRVSIGLYDLDKLRPPFYLKAYSPNALKYTPLKSEREMTLKQILDDTETGRKYAHLINSHPKYPVLVDSSEQVLALIPILNNSANAVTESTTRLFIDHTGTDPIAVNACLNILATDFADAGAKVTAVQMHYPHVKGATPDSTPSKMTLSVAYANKILGLNLSHQEMIGALGRQRISATATGDSLECSIPAYRSDFLHPIDLVEEVAIGYGYSRFEPVVPRIFTRGAVSEQTLRENFTRDFLVGAGFLELSTYVLTNSDKVSKALSGEEFVEITNPISTEFHAMRATLMPNLLEVLSKNTHVEYPQQIFEVGEVVAHNSSLPERMQTKVHAACLSAHAQSGMSEVASVLLELAKRLKKSIFFEKAQNPQFIEGRCAKVFIDAKPVGWVGELHPQVLTNFGLSVPASGFEIEL